MKFLSVLPPWTDPQQLARAEDVLETVIRAARGLAAMEMAATESYGHVIRPTPRHYVRCLLEARDLLEAEVAQYVLGELVPVAAR